MCDGADDGRASELIEDVSVTQCGHRAGTSDDLTRHRDSQSHRQSSMQAISDLPCAMIGEFALSLSVGRVGYFRCLQSDEGLAAAVRRAQLQSAAH